MREYLFLFISISCLSTQRTSSFCFTAAEVPLCACILIYDESPADGPSGCLQSFAIANRTVGNILLHSHLAQDGVSVGGVPTSATVKVKGLVQWSYGWIQSKPRPHYKGTTHAVLPSRILEPACLPIFTNTVGT